MIAPPPSTSHECPCLAFACCFQPQRASNTVESSIDNYDPQEVTRHKVKLRTASRFPSRLRRELEPTRGSERDDHVETVNRRGRHWCQMIRGDGIKQGPSCVDSRCVPRACHRVISARHTPHRCCRREPKAHASGRQGRKKPVARGGDCETALFISHRSTTIEWNSTRIRVKRSHHPLAATLRYVTIRYITLRYTTLLSCFALMSAPPTRIVEPTPPRVCTDRFVHTMLFNAIVQPLGVDRLCTRRESHTDNTRSINQQSMPIRRSS